MPPKKKPKLLPGQAVLCFGQPQPSTSQESPKDSVSASQPDVEQQCDRPSESRAMCSKKTFQSSWLTLYPWLRYESSKMYCCVRRKHGKNNTLSVGTDNFHTSTLSRHVDGIDHQLLMNAPAEAANMRERQKTALSKKEEAVVVGLKGMFWLCKEGLPLSKFRSLMQFLLHLKVPNVEHLCCRDKIDYTSDSSADDFLKVLSDIIDDNISEKAKKSPVITIFVDESTDIVVHHKLAINIRVVDPLSLQPSTFFLTDVRLHDGTGKGMFDVIKTELDKRGIPVTKVFGLGTDGASTMTGTPNRRAYGTTLSRPYMGPIEMWRDGPNAP